MDRKPVVIRKLNRDMEKLLVARGVPPYDLPSKSTKIRVEDALVSFEPSFPNIINRAMSTSKQVKVIQSLIAHPLSSSHTFCISSFPSDSRAKHLAIHLMAIACEQHRAGHRKPGRSLPLWHRVYGGFSNPLIDKGASETPSLLILTNVETASTQVKIEKVRDLLEYFSEIPKIIVTGGEPPCNLFGTRLKYPLRAGIYLGPDNRIREI